MIFKAVCIELENKKRVRRSRHYFLSRRLQITLVSKAIKRLINILKSSRKLNIILFKSEEKEEVVLLLEKELDVA